MTETSDQVVINDASTAANWTASGFDTPTLNDSAATTPIYIEGNACMWWPLKKGTTDGYVYEATANQDLSAGNIFVALINYPFSDISNIPINEMWVRLSSATGFTTNYAQWDVLAQIYSPKNTPISGFTPVMVYPTNPGETSGTPNYADLESFGWVATTGNTADGKQGGFDFFHHISWIGGHSETYDQTFFSQLNTHANPATLPGTADFPLGCFSRAGDFYRTNINIKVAIGATDTAVSVTETSKTIFFDNVEPEHNLGYIFENPNAGTSTFFLTSCVHFWNEQDGTSPAIFTTVTNVDVFKLDSCSFARGGAVDLPAHDTVTTTYVQNCSFDGCGVIDLGDITFTGNTVANALIGVDYIGSGTRRASGNTYNSNTIALSFDTAQTITIDGDTFIGSSGAGVPTEALEDNYPFVNRNTFSSFNLTRTAVGQSFTGAGGELTKLTIELRKVASPTGNLVATVYAHSGTYGTSSVPTGTALDTSTTTLDVSTLGTLWGTTYDFVFAGGITLTNGTNYVIAVEWPDGDATNLVQVGSDNTAPTHSGNGSSEVSGVWGSTAGDRPFEVYETTYAGGGGVQTDIENSSNATTADSYSETNQNATTALDAAPTAVGQSITGNGGVLSNVRWYIQKVASPTGNAVCKLYAHSGTFGTSSVPTGTALAISNSVDVSDLSTSLALVQFEFEDQYTLVNATNYVLTLEYTGDATNYVNVGTDTTAPTHGGNFSTLSGTWSAVAGTDACFYASTGGILIVNATNGANPSSKSNTGSPPGAVIIQNAVTVLVKTITSASVAIENVRVRIVTDPGGVEIINGLTDSNGEISVSYNYLADQDITGWCRKSTTSPLYKQGDVTGTITSAGFSVTVTMVLDE